MSQGIVAQRYAKALIGLTKTRKELEEAGEKLSEASEAYQSSVELQEILASNKVSYPVKQKNSGRIAGTSQNFHLDPYFLSLPPQ